MTNKRKIILRSSSPSAVCLKLKAGVAVYSGLKVLLVLRLISVTCSAFLLNNISNLQLERLLLRCVSVNAEYLLWVCGHGYLLCSQPSNPSWQDCCIL